MLICKKEVGFIMNAIKLNEFNERIYTIDDIYALPDGERPEWMEGRID